jgi:hypothetical protein
LSVNLTKERANARLAIHVFHDYDFGRRKPGYIFPPIVAMIVAESVDGGCSCSYPARNSVPGDRRKVRQNAVTLPWT